uniref:Uncharacterized protein n=1 Tax=Arion vulgaris TaxID=1028688 RepID=A0A0B7AG11_9EUPU
MNRYLLGMRALQEPSEINKPNENPQRLTKLNVTGARAVDEGMVSIVQDRV